MKKIIVVDDDCKTALEIAGILERHGYTAAVFTSSPLALNAIESVRDIDLVLTDINMPLTSGREILGAAHKRNIPVIVFTGFGDIDTAVETMKNGASDYICKPVSPKELLVRVEKVLEKRELAAEVDSLKRRLESNESFFSLVGKCKKMLEVYELIGAVAKADSPVIITGETGTGKELVARAIHKAGPRADEPFIGISCSALQPTLLESELFGHEKGAFTGASVLKTGKLELAAGGTVLLDEIGDVPYAMQPKLLRVLELMEFERVGGVTLVKLRSRLIAATNRDLEKSVKEGGFREDLYFRLNVMRIELPPLRERGEDIITLARHFLDVYKKQYNKAIEGFTPSAVTQMLEYGWPGNVRELKNAVERTALTCSKRWIDRLPVAAMTGLGYLEGIVTRLEFAKAKEVLLNDLEKTYLMHYLRHERGKIKKVAKHLNASTRTVTRLIQKHGFDKKEFRKDGITR
ncbi:MAG: sigma-54-dependent Fis family transcriptional regulator [Deltaproteobacteria bacterium]|nr:sigma-54-dependent Fis family transcriptional regulator [Deltaproteobacteria bacterium]